MPLNKYLTASGERRVSVSDDGVAGAHVVQASRTAIRITRLLEAELLTGRTHQIRVHLAHLGFPIAGDDKYGDFALNKSLQREGLKRMFLHAARVEFRHPLTGATTRGRGAACPTDWRGFWVRSRTSRRWLPVP